ncbi:MAG: hypothetical protein ABR589_03540 [Chthoniobacterales bacterium]
MKRFLPISRCSRDLHLLGTLALAAFIQTSFAHVPDDKTSNTAKNLARMNCGAQIECTTPDGRIAEVAVANDQNKSAAAVIMDDDTVSCPLQEGQTTFVIKLPTTSLLDRFTFVNENAAAAGELKIAVSNYRLPAASSKWVEVDGSITFTRKRVFNLSMLGVEARYVKLSFRVEKAGRIASLGLYGGETLERFALRQQKHQQHMAWLSTTTSARSGALEDELNSNFANLYAKAQVVYVSSGPIPSARRMIDDDNETGFRFAPGDPHPTAIVELAESRQLHRVSARYKLKIPGRLDVYLLNDISKGATDLENQKPVASVTDREGDGKAAVEFETRGARYVALRWTPANSAGAENSFEIAEIDAFGEVPLAMLQVGDGPDLYASGPEVGIKVATVPIAPVLPEVSP